MATTFTNPTDILNDLTRRDQLWMQRALDIASRGAGYVSPNPMVGCVIVSAEGAFLAEGWHKQYGGPHAEIDALNNMPSGAEDPNLIGATVYVTLEPCAHYGKTPPCALALAKLPISRVVIACQDPNPLVAGQGIRILLEAGIYCEIGLLADHAIQLNRAFFWRLRSGLPYITLKWAQTADGFIARPDYDSKWITGLTSRAWVHKLRAEVDGVAVGGATAYYDNPTLNVRDWHGHQPARLIWASKPNFPYDHNLFSGLQQTYLGWLGQGTAPDWPNVQVLTAVSAQLVIEQMKDHLRQLSKLGIQHILIEGGAQILNMLISNGLWNEAWVGTNPDMVFGAGIKAPLLHQTPINNMILGDDHWQYYQNNAI